MCHERQIFNESWRYSQSVCWRELSRETENLIQDKEETCYNITE